VTWRATPFPTGTRCCDEAQRAQVVQALDAAMRWNRANGVPVHLGEFGAYRAGDLASRAAYARLVRDEAERRGIGWAWWEWASDFSGVYDPARKAWVEPLRRALLD
jgi:endoglucanase